MNEETYLADGVYASFDGYQICLRTEGENIIYVDSTVFSRLLQFAEKSFEVKITVEGSGAVLEEK